MYYNSLCRRSLLHNVQNHIFMHPNYETFMICIFLVYSPLLSRFLPKYDASMCEAGQGFFFKQVNLNILFVDKPKLQMVPFKKHCKLSLPRNRFAY